MLVTFNVLSKPKTQPTEAMQIALKVFTKLLSVQDEFAHSRETFEAPGVSLQ